mgnify:CR=1 FL=1|tara:strand:+ start:361 stop:1260 length:900 start_codon:yes stop_codon:yes gene_type:complete
MKWIDEKVLQKYFKESFDQYNNWFKEEYSEKVVSVSYNEPFDAYPDVYATLESGKILPIEVEWTTKDFNHDPKVIEEKNGLIAVLQNNDPSFGLKQLELNEEKFKKWYIKNSERIFSESIKQIVVEDKYKIKRSPKLWFFYSGMSDKKNRNETLESGVFGVAAVFRQLDKFKDIRKNDLFCIIGPFKNFGGTGGRVSFDKFKKNRKLICEEILLFKVIEPYYYDESKIWKYQVTYLDSDSQIKNYPHRFKFDKEPILEMGDIKIANLSLTSKTGLHKLLYQIFWDGKPDLLVDLISKAK